MKKLRAIYTPIEFVTQRPLNECVSQLREARSTEFEPKYEREDSTTYKFRIRKLRRERSGREFSMVEAKVYLRSLSVAETSVIGSIHFSWGVLLTTFIFMLMLFVAVVIRELWLGIVVIGITLSYWAFVWWDRQTLVGLVKRRLGETREAKVKS